MAPAKPYLIETPPPPFGLGYRPRRFEAGTMLGFACLGTAVAGGLFPVVLVLTGVIVSPNGGRMGWGILGLTIPAFVAGSFYAGFVAVWVGLAAGIIMGLIRLRGTPVWLASLVGGWTGFICALPMADEFFIDGSLYTLGLAVAMGQTGAAWVAREAIRASRPQLTDRAIDEPTKFRLGQLFGLTTAVCVLAAIVGALNLDGATYGLIAAAAVFQAGLIGLAAACQRCRWLAPSATVEHSSRLA